MKGILLFLAILIILPSVVSAATDTHYVTQNGAGVRNGSDIDNAFSVSDFNTPSNWDTDEADDDDIGPGDTVEFSGTITSQVSPQGSGAAGNVITLTSYDTDTKFTIGGTYGCITLYMDDYITISNLTVESANEYWILISDSDHITIDNCVFSDAGDWSGIYVSGVSEGSWYSADVVIINSTFESVVGCDNTGYCSPSGPACSNPASHIYLDRARRVRIEGNTFGNASHDNIVTAKDYIRYLLVKDNDFGNTWHWGPHLIMGHFIVVEDNNVHDIGANSPSNPNIMDCCKDEGGLSGCGENSIWRGNRIWDSTHGFIFYYWGVNHGYTNKSYIYHNTFYSNDETDMMVGGGADSIHNTHIVNNVFSSCAEVNANAEDIGLICWGCDCINTEGLNYQYQSCVAGMIQMHNIDDATNRFRSNLFDSSKQIRYKGLICGTPKTVAQLEAIYPTEWSNNIAGTPAFQSTDDANVNFLKPLSDSPQRDAAGYLTQTIGAGNGYTMPVDDARFFFPGWSIPGATGDTIRVVNPIHPEWDFDVLITDRNIGSTPNTLTLASSQQWDDDAEVYWCPDCVCFPDSAPDIGADEYTASLPDCYSMGGTCCPSGQACTGTTQPASDCLACCLDGSCQDTCQGLGFECCLSCQSGPHTENDWTCSGSQVCCDECYSGELVGHWTFDSQDISGDQALDTSGFGNDGTINGATQVTGRIGEALYFDGSNDFVEIGNSELFDTSDVFTTMAWILPAGWRGGGFGTIFGKADVGEYDFMFYLRGSDSNIAAWDRSTSGFADSEDNSISLGEWQHVAVTHNGSNGVTFYINGADRTDDYWILLTNPTGNSFIGAENGTTSWGFNGTIDEVMVWNRSLSAGEILDLYDSSFHPCDDNPKDGCVQEEELIPFIDHWKYDSTANPMGEVMEAVTLWSRGTGCS